MTTESADSQATEPATPCIFCARLATGQLRSSRELAASLPDGHPLTPGHLLVIPRRHEPDFFALSEEEQAAVWALLREERRSLVREHATAHFNVGINAGEAAGQTVGHAHVHLIPRKPGDVADPRGGIRCVVPQRAAYWRR